MLASRNKPYFFSILTIVIMIDLLKKYLNYSKNKMYRKFRKNMRLKKFLP